MSKISKIEFSYPPSSGCHGVNNKLNDTTKVVLLNQQNIYCWLHAYNAEVRTLLNFITRYYCCRPLNAQFIEYLKRMYVFHYGAINNKSEYYCKKEVGCL